MGLLSAAANYEALSRDLSAVGLIWLSPRVLVIRKYMLWVITGNSTISIAGKETWFSANGNNAVALCRRLKAVLAILRHCR